MEENKYIIGVKGFDKDLKCRNFQYKVGETYKHEGKIQLCNKGFHFSPTLKCATNYYRNTLKNRFCIVKGKIPGLDIIEQNRFTKEKKYRDNDKFVTNKLTIIRELTEGEISQILNEEDSDYDKYKLDLVKRLQKTYPDLIIGGSTALYLLGFNINKSKISDLDLFTPKFIRFDKDDFTEDELIDEVDNMDNHKNSGNDFDYTAGIVYDGEFTIMDVKINPKQRFTYVNYGGFKYKVCRWEDILEAKLRYGLEGNQKHIKDIMNMLNNPKPLTDIKEKLFDKILKEIK